MQRIDAFNLLSVSIRFEPLSMILLFTLEYLVLFVSLYWGGALEYVRLCATVLH